MSAALTEAIPFHEKPLYERKETDRNVEKPHYLFLAANFIEPKAAREHPFLKAGGMRVATPCLRHTDGFVRRGAITALLENVYDPIAREQADGASDKGAYLDLPPTFDHMGLPILNPLKTRVAKPGLHLPLLLNGSTNIRGGHPKGLVEIKDLRYVDYDPQELNRIHRALIPTWPQLPVRIADLRDMLSESRSGDLATIVEDMLESCSQSELYMTRVIDQVHYEMKHSAAASGMVPQYTGLHLVFLDQLGLKPQSRELQGITETASPDFKEMFQMFRDANQEDRASFFEMMRSVMQGPQVVAPAEPEVVPEKCACECGKEFDSPQGLVLHKNRWCPLKKDGNSQE